MLLELAFLGLGAMGGGMARCLLRAGYTVTAFDPDAGSLAAVAAEGARPAASAREAVGHGQVVLTSLPNSEVLVQTAEVDLLPKARPGQVFTDLGTVVTAEVRRLAQAFAARGAALLDAPVSGGPSGAAQGELRIFVGGDHAIFQQCRDVLAVLGAADGVTYCGPSGCGQIVKGVNQLAMGLVNAAVLEALAFGVLAGVDIQTLARAVGGTTGWRSVLGGVCGQVAAEAGNMVGTKVDQLPYFLNEARRHGFDLPLSHALREFCKDGPIVGMEANRRSPSFWHQLRAQGDRRA
ncbi:MAG: NAD(P)-binding domain-containing protein [Phycisphaeraceae bacterium]